MTWEGSETDPHSWGGLARGYRYARFVPKLNKAPVKTKVGLRKRREAFSIQSVLNDSPLSFMPRATIATTRLAGQRFSHPALPGLLS